jgi:ribosome-associated heat shock protein Hsp15
MRGENDPDRDDEEGAAPHGTQRLDKWLWFARVAKSRTLAAQLVTDGKVRLNRAKAGKPAQSVRPDDVLTIAVRGHVQVLRVLAPGVRRGPPSEARLLYEVLAPAPAAPAAAQSTQGAGRPAKRASRPWRRLGEKG